LSPFATCGDLNVATDKFTSFKNTLSLSNFDTSVDSKAFVAIIVPNIATERIWLDTTDLEQPCDKLEVSIPKHCRHVTLCAKRCSVAGLSHAPQRPT
jgi:hypothetical protein